MMKRGLARFWYRFKNWFRIKHGLGEPLTFLCGSEEELRRVTTWICHIHPQIFEIIPVISVTYLARNDNTQKENLLLFMGRSEQECLDADACCGLLRSWLALAFKYNAFTGTYWDFRYDTSRTASYHPGLPRLLTIGEEEFFISVDVNPPSAHECAESLLSLSEWLDGKVSEEEKRELLQLPDDEA